jgi:hypothetical protein
MMRMMHRMDTVSTLAARWPTFSAFADDVGVAWPTAHQWRLRNRIPPTYWPDVIAAAESRGFDGITAESLLAMTVAAEESA